MIKIETGRGSVSVEVHGNLAVVLADTTGILEAIHNGLPKEVQPVFRAEVHKATAEDGLCWMTTEQKKEKAKAMLLKLLDLIEKEPGQVPEGALEDEDLEHLN